MHMFYINITGKITSLISIFFLQETGWQLNNACEDERDKIIVGTNTSGNNGGARRKTTGINGETVSTNNIFLQFYEYLLCFKLQIKA